MQRSTSAKAIVNILVVAAFFVAELYNCNEDCACIGVVFFLSASFLLLLPFLSSLFPLLALSWSLCFRQDRR